LNRAQINYRSSRQEPQIRTQCFALNGRGEFQQGLTHGTRTSGTALENSQEHKDWPNKPKEVPPRDVSGTQNIDVLVGGHPLDPSIQNREVKFTTPKRLKIKWPH